MTRVTKSYAPHAEDDQARIRVSTGAGDFTYGDHLRHLAQHAGTVPATLDEFGRCVVCVRRGWFKLDA